MDEILSTVINIAGKLPVIITNIKAIAVKIATDTTTVEKIGDALKVIDTVLEDLVKP